MTDKFIIQEVTVNDTASEKITKHHRVSDGSYLVTEETKPDFKFTKPQEPEWYWQTQGVDQSSPIIKKWHDALTEANAEGKSKIVHSGDFTTKWHVDAEHPTVEDYKKIGLSVAKFTGKDEVTDGIPYVQKMRDFIKKISDAVNSPDDRAE